MYSINDVIVGVSSSVTTLGLLLGVGRFIGKKERSIEILESQYRLNDLGASIQEVRENVAKLDGKIEGLKTSVEFISEFIRNADGGFASSSHRR